MPHWLGASPRTPHPATAALFDAHAYKAAQGRKPKLKKTLALSAPVFIENEKGRLQMSENTSLVAAALGLAERLA